MKIIALGTNGGLSTVDRNMIGTMLSRDGERFLIDCGEGISRQLMRAANAGLKTSNIRAILFTHLHSDHTLGLADVLMNMDFAEKRKDELLIVGPMGIRSHLNKLMKLYDFKPAYPIRVKQLSQNRAYGVLSDKEFRIEAFPTYHNGVSFGYRFVEKRLRGFVDAEKASALGIVTEKEFREIMTMGQVTVLKDGVPSRVIYKREILGPERRGRRVVFLGDTRPDEKLVHALQDADAAVFDATYHSKGFDDAEARAAKYGHCTIPGACALAKTACVKLAVLTHFSAKVDISKAMDEVEEFLTKNNGQYPEIVFCAEDLRGYDIPYPI